jgi:hypothetical protein
MGLSYLGKEGVRTGSTPWPVTFIKKENTITSTESKAQLSNLDGIEIVCKCDGKKIVFDHSLDLEYL